MFGMLQQFLDAVELVQSGLQNCEEGEKGEIKTGGLDPPRFMAACSLCRIGMETRTRIPGFKLSHALDPLPREALEVD